MLFTHAHLLGLVVHEIIKLNYLSNLEAEHLASWTRPLSMKGTYYCQILGKSLLYCAADHL